MYNFSIVIPHHNIPCLLERLLFTIPNRDDLEVIIVDDNSDKEIVDFEHFPGLGRKNCKVIFDKKGGGGGYARNIGLKEATGKWILFADADDYFNYCINDILDDHISDDADIVFYNANSVMCDTYVNANRVNHLNNMINLFHSDKEQSELLLRYKFGEPWCKIIKKDLITNFDIKFDETLIHNDTTFSYMVGFYAQKINIDDRAGYCVTKRSGSVSLQETDNRKLQRINVFGRSAKFFKEHHINVSENRHIVQLRKLYVENKNLFNLGLDEMEKIGYDRNVLLHDIEFYYIQLKKKENKDKIMRCFKIPFKCLRNVLNIICK